MNALAKNSRILRKMTTCPASPWLLSSFEPRDPGTNTKKLRTFFVIAPNSTHVELSRPKKFFWPASCTWKSGHASRYLHCTALHYIAPDCSRLHQFLPPPSQHFRFPLFSFPLSAFPKRHRSVTDNVTGPISQKACRHWLVTASPLKRRSEQVALSCS
jgi:hypothetical protein